MSPRASSREAHHRSSDGGVPLVGHRLRRGALRRYAAPRPAPCVGASHPVSEGRKVHPVRSGLAQRLGRPAAGRATTCPGSPRRILEVISWALQVAWSLSCGLRRRSPPSQRLEASSPVLSEVKGCPRDDILAAFASEADSTKRATGMAAGAMLHPFDS